MTLATTHNLIAMHSGVNSDYYRNPSRMSPGGVMQDNDQQVMDKLMIGYGLGQHREMKPYTVFEPAFKH